MADEKKTEESKAEDIEALKKALAESEAKREKAEADKEAAEELLEKVKEKAEKKTKAEPAKPEEKPGADLDDLVPVKLFYDGSKYKDDYEVTVNGERILIRRGVTVMIKKKFALVIEQSQLQDDKTRELIEKFEGDYREAEKKNT